MRCPDCHGRGSKDVLYACAVKLTSMACSRCKSSGQVPDEMPKWIELGKVLRAWRDERDRSLLEEAKRRKISPATLSDYELGKVEPVFPPEYSAPLGGAA